MDIPDLCYAVDVFIFHGIINKMNMCSVEIPAGGVRTWYE